MADRRSNVVRWRGENAFMLHRRFRREVINAILRFAGSNSLSAYVFLTSRENMEGDDPMFLTFRIRGTLYLAVTLREYTIVYKMRDISNHLIAQLRLTARWDRYVARH